MARSPRHGTASPKTVTINTGNVAAGTNAAGAVANPAPPATAGFDLEGAFRALNVRLDKVEAAADEGWVDFDSGEHPRPHHRRAAVLGGRLRRGLRGRGYPSDEGGDDDPDDDDGDDYGDDDDIDVDSDDGRGAGDAGFVSHRVAEQAALSSGQLFAGWPTPLPHDPGNPFPRAVSLRHSTSHYDARTAGDSVHGALFTLFNIPLGGETVNADGTLKARPSDGIRRELCTLVPACSYLFDVSAALDEIIDRVGDRATRAALRAVAVQVESVRQHLGERTDEIEKYGTGGPLGAAVFSPMYGNERSQTGARSRLGEAMHASLVSKRFSSLASTVAKRDAKALGPNPAYRRALAQMPDGAGRRSGARRRAGGGGSGGSDGAGGGGSDRRPAAAAGERQAGGRGNKGGGRGKGGGNGGGGRGSDGRGAAPAAADE